MSKRLEGKIAVVTGASKGIGANIAKELGAAGASVVVNYASSKEGADRVVNEIVQAGGKAIAIQGDVSKQEDIDRLFAETKKSYGRLDILVNNAGVYEFGPLESVAAASFHRMFDLNVLGLLLTSQKAVAEFGDGGGSIVNISSGAAISPPPNGSVYSATKGAVDTITRSLAKELGPRGIRVNSLSPGPVETEGFHAMGVAGSEMEKGMVAQTPLGRLGQPSDIGSVAVFLSSDESGWITGQVLQVSGGLA